MKVKEIDEKEITRLLDCITQLSEYHNKVSVNFKGSYPSRPYNDTLNIFSESIKNGQSRIGIIENEDKVIGFCKIDIIEKKGKLDYLVVLPEYHQQGLGRLLMDWAMDTFRKNNITHIEVKVIDGNKAIHLYEKYGFKMNSHILWYCED